MNAHEVLARLALAGMDVRMNEHGDVLVEVPLNECRPGEYIRAGAVKAGLIDDSEGFATPEGWFVFYSRAVIPLAREGQRRKFYQRYSGSTEMESWSVTTLVPGDSLIRRVWGESLEP